MKRLKSLLETYKEKQKDFNTIEVEQRQQVIDLLKQGEKLFQSELKEQSQ